MTEEEADAKLNYEAADTAHALSRHRLLRALDAFDAANSQTLETAGSALLEAARAYRQTGLAWHDSVMQWSIAKVKASKKKES